MSKYRGYLEEEKFNFIAVDNFTLDVVKSASVFFLSHYHSDHFCGLRINDGWEKEQVSNIFKANPEKRLYCSEITKRLFISDDFDRIPENQIVGLPVGECLVVAGPEQDGSEPVLVTVTLIPSGHILGAVMFLFEHEDECVLYTGDFRIYPDDIPKLNTLHYRNRTIKPITHLYLDTTFGYSDYSKFPLRSDISTKIVQLISDWFRSGYVVHIDLPYKFAYETLILDLCKGLKCKIAVDPKIYHSCYACIPELCDAMYPADEDCDRDKHKIHAFIGKRIGARCIFCCKYKTFKVIRPCAMSFNANTLINGPISTSNCGGYEHVNVVYSSHCSYEELKAFVNYLKPKKITTIVNHSPSQFLKIKEQILSLIIRDPVKDISLVGNCSRNLKSSPIKSLPYRYESSDDNAEEYEGQALDSPPW